MGMCWDQLVLDVVVSKSVFLCWDASLSTIHVDGVIPACLDLSLLIFQAAVIVAPWRFFRVVESIALASR